MGFCYFAYLAFTQQTSDKNMLLKSLVNKSYDDIRSISFVSGHMPEDDIVCSKFNNTDDIKEIVSWLKKADEKHHGGHVVPIRKAKLILTDKDNVDYVYLLSTYDRHPSDAFLSMNHWIKNPNGTYTQKGALPVRVPGFSNWIFSKIDFNSCPSRYKQG